jgi:tripartite-type tricarboxylate transporter receptor subunit TctC
MPLIRSLLAATLGVLTFVSSYAQVAEQPIRIIIPYPPGGAGDATARVLGSPCARASSVP